MNDRSVPPPAPLTAEQAASMLKVVEAASAAQPNEARWLVARSILEGRAGNKQRAVELSAQAVRLAPGSAQAHFWHGSALFENIGNVGMFSKMGVASEGEAAFLKAAELDPTYLEPRFGLIQFYVNAPGIAGGSLKKARKQAEAMIAAGGRGVSSGHSMLAMIAAKDESWDEAVKQHRLAVEASESPQDKFNALAALGVMLARDRKDPNAALSVAAEARALGVEDDSSADFITGLARQQLKQYEQAAGAYREVIRKNPGAVNSRFALAECLEKAGDRSGAAGAYEDFAARFPKEARSEDAKSRAKKLRKR